MLSRPLPPVNLAYGKRMPRPGGTPAPLPMSELIRMYERRARYNTQMAAKAARRVSWNSEVTQ